MSAVRLGPALGKGGEGTVFPVRGAPKLVAKIYRKAPGAAKIRKLEAMTRGASPALLRAAAWPIDLLVDDSKVVRGFLMPRVSAREDVHELYSPKSRRQAFPKAGFRFVVHVSANIARAFAVVHAQGHVIGDVNHGNALIGHDGTVVLIDCDSFQIRDRSDIFTCDVGVPLFTAPELQGRGFRGLHRSAGHDAFGLAVLLFHLLFIGRHPFAGRHAGGDMPIERAIAESRFAYGQQNAALGMSAPPGTLPLLSFGPRIAGLFERAFAPPGDASRPAATEWIGALEELENELTPCAASGLHFHPPGLPCCWCEIEGRTGTRLFGDNISDGPLIGPTSVETLWSAIAAVQRPIAEPTFPRSEIERAPPEHKPSRLFRMLVSIILFAMLVSLFPPRNVISLAFLALIGALAPHPATWRRLVPGATKAHRELPTLERRWKKLMEQWNRECSEEPFNRALRLLQRAKVELEDLAKVRRVQLKALARRIERQQRERYLSDFRIPESVLQNLGWNDRVVLNDKHIKTAADLARAWWILRKTLSEAADSQLSAWHRACALKFQFDPTEVKEPRHTAVMDEQLRTRQALLVARLRDGPAILQRKRDEIIRARARLQQALNEARSLVLGARHSIAPWRHWIK